MIKVGQTTTNETITLPYELNNDGDTSISLQELKGNTTQNGTPTPTSPKQVNVVKGINLAGDVYIDTRTDRYINTLIINYDFMPNTTYTFSFYGTNGNKIYPNENLFTSQTQINIGTSKIVVSLTTKPTLSKTDVGQYDTATNRGWKIFKNSIVETSANVFNELQLEQGSTATPYLPYNTIQVKVVGKNLFDINETELGDINTSTGEDVSSTTIRRTRYIQVQSNTTYTISFNNTTNNKRIFLYNSNKQLINTTLLAPAESVKTITTTSETQYIRLKIVSTQFNEETQLEQGSTATTYEAYKSNNYPITLGDIELCKIGTYQDRIYKNNGKWYLEKQIGKNTLVGTETFSPMKMTTCYGYYKSLSPQAKPNESNASLTGSFTNRFAEVTPNANWGSASGVKNFAILNSTGQIRFSFGDTTNELETFKTWLTTNNVIVYYILNTPTTTEITDETLLEQLEAIGELYRGTNNIMITDTIAPVENIIIEKSNAEFDIVPYIKREPKIDYIDRKGDTGYTADGHYFENIIARKRAVEFELIPMSQDNYLSVISHFIDKTEIPVYIDDLFTGETNLINTWRKEKIPTKQIIENGTIRGTTIKLEEI